MDNRYTLAFPRFSSIVDKRPCSPSALTRFRKKNRMGCELILQASVRIHGKKELEKDCTADNTVKKNITFRTPLKLTIKEILLIYKIAAFMRIPLARNM